MSYDDTNWFQRALIAQLDTYLDDKVSGDYKEQPLAQDWARISKVSEELGEAIEQFILFTGQNPRKPRNEQAIHEMLREMADVALTAILCIQHFTKNITTTDAILAAKLHHNWDRVFLPASPKSE